MLRVTSKFLSRCHCEPGRGEPIQPQVSVEQKLWIASLASEQLWPPRNDERIRLQPTP